MRLWVLALCACGFRHGEASHDAVADNFTPDLPIDGAPPAQACAPLPAAQAPVIVSDITALRTAIQNATPGTTIEVSPGTYSVTQTLSIATPGITIRSQGDNAAAVILDGAVTTAPILRVGASYVTIASLTVARSAQAGILVTPASTTDVTGVKLYDITFDDDVGPSLRLYPGTPSDPTVGPYVDAGLVACSRFRDTTAVDHCTVPATLGIDAIAVRDWVIRDNRFTDMTCPTAFHRTVLVRGGSRDTVVTRNRMLDGVGNIQLGIDTTNLARSYTDPLPATCSGTPQHWGGVVCNNAIAGLGVVTNFDHGIALWGACETWALHNTVVSPSGNTFDDIEYRFPGTYVHLVNNLLLQAPFARDSAVQDPAYATSNALYAATTDFVDPASADLHLSATAAESPGAPINGLTYCQDDADGKPRPPSGPMPGAYER